MVSICGKITQQGRAHTLATPNSRRLSMTFPPLFDLQVLSKLLLPPWERVLWQAQPYDDNYTDRTFLQSLITNENFSEYDFWRIVRDSVVVTQHLSATVIFLAMFYLTNYCYVQLRWMLFVDVLLGAAGCAAMILTTMYKVRASFNFRGILLFGCARWTLY